MNDFKKHQTSHDIARFFVGLIGVALLFMLSTVAVRAAYGMYQTFSVAAQGHESATLQLQELEAEKSHVNATLYSLGSERGVEAAVRERFGVVKSGEGEIRIVRDKGEGEAGDAAAGDNMFVQFFQSLFVW